MFFIAKTVFVYMTGNKKREYKTVFRGFKENFYFDF